jgi:hypothetical protein
MSSPDPFANATETFSAPIEDLIIALGQGLAEAQKALDLSSIATQEAIDADPVLSQYGLQAPWYQFPNVTLQLKLSIAMAQDQTPPAPVAGPASAALLTTPVRLRIVAQPVSPSFQNQFNYNARAASQVNVTIVPVPPPQAPGQTVPRMTQPQVQAAAFASAAKFVTVKDTSGTLQPAPTDGKGNALRFDVNFNGASSTWYVLQYAPTNTSVTPVVVAVDDTTGAVRVISSP